MFIIIIIIIIIIWAGYFAYPTQTLTLLSRVDEPFPFAFLLAQMCCWVGRTTSRLSRSDE